MAFYLLTWTYFNDVNGSKNLKLKESFLWVATRKNETISLKPFIFEPKTIIGYINSSNSGDDEGVEFKVKRISNNKWCECSAKAVVGWCSSK